MQQVLFVIWTFGSRFTRFCSIEVSKVMHTVVLGWQQVQLHVPTGWPQLLQNLAGCMILFSGCRKFRAVGSVKAVFVVVLIGAFCVVLAALTAAFWVVFCAFAADKSSSGGVRS